METECRGMPRAVRASGPRPWDPANRALRARYPSPPQRVPQYRMPRPRGRSPVHATPLQPGFLRFCRFFGGGGGPPPLAHGDAPSPEYARQHSPIIEADGASRQPEGLECCRSCGEQLTLGDRARLTDDVNVTLHKLAVPPFLRAFCPPDRPNVNRPKNRRQLPTVGGIKPRQRHREI